MTEWLSMLSVLNTYLNQFLSCVVVGWELRYCADVHQSQSGLTDWCCNYHISDFVWLDSNIAHVTKHYLCTYSHCERAIIQLGVLHVSLITTAERIRHKLYIGIDIGVRLCLTVSFSKVTYSVFSALTQLSDMKNMWTCQSKIGPAFDAKSSAIPSVQLPRNCVFAIIIIQSVRMLQWYYTVFLEKNTHSYYWR